MTRWKKERLAEQLKFFGAKKTEFISVYAKKPRIRYKAKVKQVVSASYTAEQAGLSALYQAQTNRGIEMRALGFNQMAQAQSAMSNQFSGQLGDIGNQSALCNGLNQGLLYQGNARGIFGG